MEYCEKRVAIVDDRRRSGITLRSYQVEFRCPQAITDRFTKQHGLDILVHVVHLIDIHCVARRGVHFLMGEPELEILTPPGCVEDGFVQSLQPEFVLMLIVGSACHQIVRYR
jgi:hypothetical protein